MPPYALDPDYRDAPTHLKERYDIYYQSARALGWHVKTFREWVTS